MLDIIIPTYKNQVGLNNTLESIIEEEQIHITVVIDCDNLDYEKIQKKYPQVTFITLSKNSGPGVARQVGLSATTEPYVTFIDTGDKFINSDYICATIKENSNYYLYSWAYMTDANVKSTPDIEKLHARVFVRDFIERHNISFSEEGSYANEDLGFLAAYKLLLKSENKMNRTLYIDEILMKEIHDNNSITHKNNSEFMYKDCVRGISINTQHVIEIAQANNVSQELILNELKRLTKKIIFFYQLTFVHRKALVPQIKADLKDFYVNTYLHYLEPNKTIALLLK